VIQPADGKDTRSVNPTTAKQRFVFSCNLPRVAWMNMPNFDTTVDLTQKKGRKLGLNDKIGRSNFYLRHKLLSSGS